MQLLLPEVLEVVELAGVVDVVAVEVELAPATGGLVELAAGTTRTGSTRSRGARSGSCDQFCLLRALIDDCNSETSIACTVNNNDNVNNTVRDKQVAAQTTTRYAVTCPPNSILRRKVIDLYYDYDYNYNLRR